MKKRAKMLPILLLLFYALFVSCTRQENTEVHELTIIHINDVHSHLDEFNRWGSDCSESDECFGGYARVKAAIQEIRQRSKNSILLDAGDEFQGTLFYNFYKGEKISEILNELDVDAMTLGNHEFDDGPELLGKFLHSLDLPIVCSNLNTSVTSLSSALKPYIILEEQEMAIIGLITPTTSSMSSSGPNVSFTEPVAVIQPLIDEIKSKGIHKIIALTHIGYFEDQQLVRSTRGLSMVVGGHSHTLLGKQPKAEGPYPTNVKDLDGRMVPIVTDYKWGEFLGAVDVMFDKAGQVISHKHQPIHLGPHSQKDLALESRIKQWRTPFDKFAQEVIGYATGVFDESFCQFEECAIGDFIADSMLLARRSKDAPVQAALMNAGGIRASINEGNITRGEIMTAFPFGSSLVDLSLSGQELLDVLEGIVSRRNLKTGHDITSFAQIAGLRILFDSSESPGNRLLSAEILNAHSADVYAPVDPNGTYVIVTLDFMANGGDYWWSPRTDYIPLDLLDQTIMDRVQMEGTISPETDGRIKITSKYYWPLASFKLVASSLLRSLLAPFSLS